MTNQSKLSQAAENEAFVRGVWERVHTGAAALHLSDYCASIVVSGEEFPNWSAAASFTRERQRQIAEIEEEIEWLHKRDSITPELQLLYDKCDLRFSAQFLAEKEIFSRTLARLTAIRDDLKRGMK